MSDANAADIFLSHEPEQLSLLAPVERHARVNQVFAGQARRLPAIVDRGHNVGCKIVQANQAGEERGSIAALAGELGNGHVPVRVNGRLRLLGR